MTTIPPLKTRQNVSFWRLRLFVNSWGEEYPTDSPSWIQREWLLAKTISLVESDRLFMPDGPGAIERIMRQRDE